MKKNILFILGLVALLTACSSASYKPTAAETASAARSVEILNNGSVPNRQYASTKQPAYQVRGVSGRISPQDVLDVNVFKVPDLSVQKVTVESSGLISLPLIGSVRVAGLSITQAEQKITQLLKEYMQDPKVRVTRTDKAVSKRVTVEGEVKAPGVFPIKGDLSFLQAIAMAQGLSELGDSRTVLFYRDGRQHVINLDLVRTGKIADPSLKGDDRIIVLKDPQKVREKKVLDYLPVITAPLSVIPGL